MMGMHIAIQSGIDPTAWDIRGGRAGVHAVFYTPGTTQTVRLDLSADDAIQLAKALERAARNTKRAAETNGR